VVVSLVFEDQEFTMAGPKEEQEIHIENPLFWQQQRSPNERLDEPMLAIKAIDQPEDGTESLSSPSFQDDTSSQETKHSYREEKLLFEIDRSNEEFDLLQACKGRSPFVVISGAQGSGKTHLAEKVPAQYLLRGKFERNSAIRPFGPMLDAFTQYVNIVQERNEIEQVRDWICERLSTYDQQSLLRHAPFFAPLLPDNLSDEQPTQLAVGVYSTGSRLLKTLFSIISRPETPVVLLLDDMHFASSHVVPFLKSLFKTSIEGLIIMATVSDDAPATADKSHVQSLLELQTASVSLNPLSAEAVRLAIAETLQADISGMEDVVAAVHDSTNGNLYHLTDFLRALKNTPVGPSDDPKEIYLRSQSLLCDSLPEYLDTKMRDIISHEGREILKVASAFGTSEVKLELVCMVLGADEIEDHINGLVQNHLVRRLAEGLVCFENDAVQLAAYRLVAKEDRKLLHLEIGRRIWRKSHEGQLESNLAFIMSQHMQGAELITREKERVSLATLSLQAAIGAAKCSSHFHVATAVLDFGIRLLGPRGWKDNYDITLRLHNMSAEMLMLMKMTDEMNKVIDTVIVNARSSLDKCHVWCIRIYVLGNLDKQNEAQELALSALERFGVRVPKSNIKASIIANEFRLRRMLMGKSEEQILRLPMTTQDSHVAIFQVISVSLLNFMLVKPELAGVFAQKCMNLTLQHGHCTLSCLSFLSYGMLRLQIGDIEAADKFGKLALQSLEKHGSTEYLPRVYAAYYGMIQSWKHDIKDSLEPLMYAYNVGLQSGDYEYACLCLGCYCYNATECATINEVVDICDDLQDHMVSHEQTKLLNMSVSFVVGLRLYLDFDGNKSISDATQEMLRAGASSPMNESEARKNCMVFCYLMGEHEEAFTYRDCLDLIKEALPTFQLVSGCFVLGMLSLALARKNQRERRKHLRRSKMILRKLKKWARLSPHSAMMYFQILLAETESILGENDRAYAAYVCAIHVSDQEQGLIANAVAKESLGLHLYRLGNKAQSQDMLEQACESFDKWGAVTVRKRLEGDMERLFAIPAERKELRYSSRSM